MSNEPGDSVRGRTPYLPIHETAQARAARRCAASQWTIVKSRTEPVRPCRVQCCRHQWASRCCPTCQLVVARVRHAGRLLALPRGAGRAQAQGHVRDERHARPRLSARPAGRARGGLGIHGTWLRAAADAPGGRPAAAIADTIAAIRTSPASRRAAGKSPGLTETDDTSTCWPSGHRVRGRLGARRAAGAGSRRAGRMSRCPIRSRSTTS